MQMDNKSAGPTGPECLSPDIASAFATRTKGTPQFQHGYGKNAGFNCVGYVCFVEMLRLKDDCDGERSFFSSDFDEN